MTLIPNQNRPNHGQQPRLSDSAASESEITESYPAYTGKVISTNALRQWHSTEKDFQPTGNEGIARNEGLTGALQELTGPSPDLIYEELLPYDPIPLPTPAELKHASTWSLMGNGRPKYTKDQRSYKCGQVRFMYRCGRNHEAHATERCYNPKCPICCGHWKTRATRRATARLTAAINYFGHYPKHITFSKPQGKTTFADYKADLYRTLRRVNCDATMTLFHPYRFRDQQGEAVSYKDWQNDPVRNYKIYSPHFHLMAFGQLIKSNKVHDRTGWVYKNLGKRKSRTQNNDDQIGGTVDYLLSHAGIQTGYHTLAWTGTLKRMKVTFTKEQEAVTCEAVLPDGNKCQLHMSKLEMDKLGTGDWAVSEPFAHRWRKNRSYNWNDPAYSIAQRTSRSLLRHHPKTAHARRIIVEATTESILELTT